LGLWIPAKSTGALHRTLALPQGKCVCGHDREAQFMTARSISNGYTHVLDEYMRVLVEYMRVPVEYMRVLIKYMRVLKRYIDVHDKYGRVFKQDTHVLEDTWPVLKADTPLLTPGKRVPATGRLVLRQRQR